MARRTITYEETVEREEDVITCDFHDEREVDPDLGTFWSEEDGGVEELHLCVECREEASGEVVTSQVLRREEWFSSEGRFDPGEIRGSVWAVYVFSATSAILSVLAFASWKFGWTEAVPFFGLFLFVALFSNTWAAYDIKQYDPEDD